MKRILRLVMTQATANYKKEETIDNKMTYPLPPISTVIGMLHNICGYKSYMPMEISVQGKYETMSRRLKKSKVFHNSLQDDRGTLVKMCSPSIISEAYTKVAKSLDRGSSYKENKNIIVNNNELYQEYIYCHQRKKELTEKLKIAKNNLAEVKKVTKDKNKLEELINTVKLIQSKQKENQYVLDHYRTFDCLLTQMEILHDVKLILHVRAEENIINDILNNECNFKALGRRSDGLQIKEMKIISLKNIDKPVYSKYFAYIDYNEVFKSFSFTDEREARGTCYYLNKDYEIKDGRRVFNKIKVLYTSDYIVDKLSDNVCVDEDDYVVNFL